MRKFGGGVVPRAYDVMMKPCERRAFGRWRAHAWAVAPRGGTGIEIGAGTGANYVHHPAGAWVLATDLSSAMLRRGRTQGRAGGVPLLAADTLALPFRAATFDWAVETLVFCEVADPVAGLREIHRVLRPGGRLVMLEHVRPAGLLGRLADAATVIVRPFWGEHFNRDAEAAARAAGFTVLQRQWLWRDIVVLLVLQRGAD